MNNETNALPVIKEIRAVIHGGSSVTANIEKILCAIETDTTLPTEAKTRFAGILRRLTWEVLKQWLFRELSGGTQQTPRDSDEEQSLIEYIVAKCEELDIDLNDFF